MKFKYLAVNVLGCLCLQAAVVNSAALAEDFPCPTEDSFPNAPITIRGEGTDLIEDNAKQEAKEAAIQSIQRLTQDERTTAEARCMSFCKYLDERGKETKGCRFDYVNTSYAPLGDWSCTVSESKGFFADLIKVNGDTIWKTAVCSRSILRGSRCNCTKSIETEIIASE